MKRCPECEFLYEDEQECCDMDGTVLRFTSFLPPFAPPQPHATNDPKSIWSGLAIPLIALIVIGSVLVTLYRAAPPKISSSSATKNQLSGTNQEAKLPVSDSPQLVTAPAIPLRPAEPSSVPATRAQNTAAKSTRPSQSTNEKRLTIEPAKAASFARTIVAEAGKSATTSTRAPCTTATSSQIRKTSIAFTS